jgi:precorrin-3B synthase
VAARTRPDLCPGVLRPWPAEDGGLVRVRLVAGAVTAEQLRGLSAVAAAYGDGDLHLTGRANLQLRGLPLEGDRLPTEVQDAVAATGLLPHPTHELVRNVMLSPRSGLGGETSRGIADLRPVAAAYDRLLCADDRLAALPGRFLVVLDDGTGDLQGRALDLGAMAVDGGHAQLRAGPSGWGDVVALEDVAGRLVALAHAFLDARGEGPSAAWHVDELDRPLLAGTRDVRTWRNAGPLPYGPFDGGLHVEVPDGVLGPELVSRLTGLADRLVVTPWKGVVPSA